jgi:integrase
MGPPEGRPSGQRYAYACLTRSRAAAARQREREHLTETEIEKLIEAAKGNRYGHRDATMILVAYRHGLRASEICELTWDAIDFHAATMHITRKKHGQPATHQVRGDESGHCGSYKRSRSRNQHSCSRRNVVAPRLAGTASTGW